jgi:hypothetical protein
VNFFDVDSLRSSHWPLLPTQKHLAVTTTTDHHSAVDRQLAARHSAVALQQLAAVEITNKKLLVETQMKV